MHFVFALSSEYPHRHSLSSFPQIKQKYHNQQETSRIRAHMYTLILMNVRKTCILTHKTLNNCNITFVGICSHFHIGVEGGSWYFLRPKNSLTIPLYSL